MPSFSWAASPCSKLPVNYLPPFSVRDQISRQIASFVQYTQYVEQLVINTIEQQEREVIQLLHQQRLVLQEMGVATRTDITISA